MLPFSFNGYSQTVSLPDPLNEITVNPIAFGIGSLNERDTVGNGYEMEFSVPAVIDGVGLPDNNEFHWIVYGGTIESVTGGTIVGEVKTYADGVNVVTEVNGTGWKNGESSIKIKWQKDDCDKAFIAVKQTSEYGCSDDIYSIYYVDVRNVYINLDIEKEEDGCAMFTDNYISYDLTISNHLVDESWRFKYELRTKNGGEDWSAWSVGTSDDVVSTPGDLNEGYVVVPAGSGNDKYTLNVPVSDNLVKGSGDLMVEIRILDVRDGNNSTLKDNPDIDLKVVLHKIPHTDFNITSDD